MVRHQNITATLKGPYPPTNFRCHIFRYFHVFWVKILENYFAKKCQRITNATSQKRSGEQRLEPKLKCFVFKEKLFLITITCSFRHPITSFQLRSKFQEAIENLKISADSAFPFWAIEPKWKRGIGGISRKGHFRRKGSDQSHFCCKESIMNSFNY